MINFVKMHGAGNDFIMIDNFSLSFRFRKSEIKALCHRYLGVGADGIILVEPGKNGGDCFMNYINADGSFAEMCGNGSRCTADFMKRFKNFTSRTLNLETYGGPRQIKILPDNLFTVNMGKPSYNYCEELAANPLVFDDRPWHEISLGNPHVVGFYGSEAEIDEKILNVGAKIESNTERYTDKVNVNFVAPQGKNSFVVKTYERGSGLTLACGTGAAASFAWLSNLRWCSSFARIKVPGGTLYFEYNNKNEILMTGPSALVYKGKIDF